MLGHDVIGSDNSEKAVNDSIANLNWLKNQYQVSSSEFQVFQADATSENYINQLETRNSKLGTSHKNFVFVTEPYLGQPKKFKSSLAVTAREYEEVKKLYIDFLTNLQKIYSSNEVRSSQPSVSNNNIVLCVIFPLVETSEGKRFSLFSESVDELRNLGYNQLCQPFIYGRDYQVVKREIVLLQMQKKS